jgi:hypothetical protein
MQTQLTEIKQLIDIAIQRGIFANAESVIQISNTFNEIVKYIQDNERTIDTN